MKVALTIAFDGTNYCGWQAQKNGNAIQTAVCEAAARVYGTDIPVTGCSRTDAGVHAYGFVCHLEAPFIIPADALPLAFNRVLPPDIAVRSACEVGEDFHARYSAAGKEYLYRIRNSRLRDPFENGRALLWPHPLDETALDRAAQAFVGRYDFRAFMASGSKIDPKLRFLQRPGQRLSPGHRFRALFSYRIRRRPLRAFCHDRHASLPHNGLSGPFRQRIFRGRRRDVYARVRLCRPRLDGNLD